MAKYSLKTKNLKFIVPILIIDTVVIWSILWVPKVATGLIKVPVFGALGLSITLMINHLIPSNIKDVFVFLRLRNALPGCRAFSELVHSDPRIDTNALQKKLDGFPLIPKEQNVLWYRLFKQHESNIMVQEAHQRFLFFRDIAVISALMLVVIAISAFISTPNFYDYKYALVIVGQYILFMIAARNSANRLVQNVLAIETTTVKSVKKKKRGKKNEA